MNRRIFLLAGGSVALAQSPNSRVVVGLIGAGGRGRNIMGIHRQDPDVKIGAVCDIYEPNLEAGLSDAGGGAKAYRNYKELLADKDIDVVIIATRPSIGTIACCSMRWPPAKTSTSRSRFATPGSKASSWCAPRAKSKSIVQVGMQRRSYELYQQARDLRRAGARHGSHGAQLLAEQRPVAVAARLSKARSIGSNGWGRRRTVPKDAVRFFNWRDFSDYSGGIVMDQGAHIYDAIHMIMDAGYPSAVTAAAGKAHRAGRRSAGVVGGDRRVSGRFPGGVHDQLRGHEVPAGGRSTERLRWR